MHLLERHVLQFEELLYGASSFVKRNLELGQDKRQGKGGQNFTLRL